MSDSPFLSFTESRLSAVESSQRSIAAAARILAARGWPDSFHHRDDAESYEFHSRALTGLRALDWLVVAGFDTTCPSDSEHWVSLSGRCESVGVERFYRPWLNHTAQFDHEDWPW